MSIHINGVVKDLMSKRIGPSDKPESIGTDQALEVEEKIAYSIRQQLDKQGFTRTKVVLEQRGRKKEL